MEFTSSQYTFKPGLFQVAGNPSSPGILSLGIFQASIISRILRILMAGSSKHFGASTSRFGPLSFFSPSAISSIKSAGHFLFSIHASGVNIFSNFRLAHNKWQQSDSAKVVTFFVPKKAPILPRRCAWR